MNHGGQQRPSRRSTPISQLIPKSDNELNIQKSKYNRPENGKVKKPLNKAALQNFHTPDGSDDRKSFKKLKISPTTPVTPLKKLSLSEIASTPLKFKVFPDQPAKQAPTPKIPISDIAPQSHIPQVDPDAIEKVPLQKILDLAQCQPFNELPMLKTNSTNLTSLDLAQDSNSLLYQAQLPLVHLNNWYRITQHQIVERNNEVKVTHEIISSTKFNDQLSLASCKRISDSEEETVLLLNYRQHPIVSSKIQDIQIGSKISLSEGYKVLDSLKLYRNWKLQT